MEKYLVYCHPSIAPTNIKLNTWYSLNELKERFTIEEIKCFFTPCNFSFSELNNENKKKSDKNK